MPKLNGTGPDGRGAKTGQGRGEYEKKPFPESFEKLGTGQGKRRKSGGGKGQGKRLR